MFYVEFKWEEWTAEGEEGGRILSLFIQFRSGKKEFGQGKVREKSGNFISHLPWLPCFMHVYMLPLLMYRIMSNLICHMWKGLGRIILHMSQGYDLDTLTYLYLCGKGTLSQGQLAIV